MARTVEQKLQIYNDQHEKVVEKEKLWIAAR